jgi:hypothetical protein
MSGFDSGLVNFRYTPGFMSDTLANRPVTALTNTVFFDTSTPGIDQYVSGAWQPIFPPATGFVPSSRTLTIAGLAQDLSANRTWNVSFASLTGKPTTLAGYGITDAVPASRALTIAGTTQDLSTDRTFNISFASLTGKPTTLAGYGITDAVPASRALTIAGTTQDLSTDRTFNVSFASLTGKPTTLAGYGITDAVPASRALTIAGTTQDLSTDRTFNISFASLTSKPTTLAGYGITDATLQQITTNGATTTNAMTSNFPGLTTTVTNAWLLQNTTAATVSVKMQNSPAVHWKGNSWNAGGTPASNTSDWYMFVEAQNNSGLGDLAFYSSINGGTVTQSIRFRFDASGNSWMLLPSGPAIVDTLSGSIGIYAAGSGSIAMRFLECTFASVSGTIHSKIESTASNWLLGTTTNVVGFKLNVNGNTLTQGSITTAQPSGTGAGAWKLGKRIAATVVLVTSQYIELDVDNVVYKLATVA